jgi:hypothetical protein
MDYGCRWYGDTATAQHQRGNNPIGTYRGITAMNEANKLISIFVGIGVAFWLITHHDEASQFFAQTATAATGLSSGIAHI